MPKPRFTGVITALVTPFHEDGSLDLAAYRALVREQLAAGVDGLVPCGTTGESVTLSQDEHRAVVTACRDEARGMVPVIAGAGANDTKKAVYNQRAMHELGVDATLHVTPYYNKPTQEGLYRHFRAVAEAAPTPVILYNVPGRTGVDLLPETVARLAADCPTIVGVKEATGSVARAQDVLNRVAVIHGGEGRDDFAVLSGDDGLILGLLAVGGHGVISVISHLCCKELSQMFKAFRDGKHAEAQALAKRISPLAQILFFRTSPMPVKTAVAWRGLIKKTFRLPLCSLDDGEEAQLKKMLMAEGWLS
ncbi:MAG: 4-hydroxy-tetrahydrodipicolinate synthase [Deltaproteobacteria bacterium RBG_16_71_12]|nr:MAG: 4-hydroxy-tetrahydrodipicolinate synthase [Deltaproteobacteria bacterium RBG_16_71_12]